MQSSFTCSRIAMVFEGLGIDYTHAKLYPMHHSDPSSLSINTAPFDETYPGYLSSHPGQRLLDENYQCLYEKLSTCIPEIKSYKTPSK